MKKRTTVYLDHDTCKKFKLYCLENEVSMSEVLEREIKRLIRIDNTLNYVKRGKRGKK